MHLRVIIDLIYKKSLSFQAIEVQFECWLPPAAMIGTTHSLLEYTAAQAFSHDLIAPKKYMRVFLKILFFAIFAMHNTKHILK